LARLFWRGTTVSPPFEAREAGDIKDAPRASNRGSFLPPASRAPASPTDWYPA